MDSTTLDAAIEIFRRRLRKLVREELEQALEERLEDDLPQNSSSPSCDPTRRSSPAEKEPSSDPPRRSPAEKEILGESEKTSLPSRSLEGSGGSEQRPETGLDTSAGLDSESRHYVHRRLDEADLAASTRDGSGSSRLRSSGPRDDPFYRMGRPFAFYPAALVGGSPTSSGTEAVVGGNGRTAVEMAGPLAIGRPRLAIAGPLAIADGKEHPALPATDRPPGGRSVAGRAAAMVSKDRASGLPARVSGRPSSGRASGKTEEEHVAFTGVSGRTSSPILPHHDRDPSPPLMMWENEADSGSSCSSAAVARGPVVPAAAADRRSRSSHRRSSGSPVLGPERSSPRRSSRSSRADNPSANGADKHTKTPAARQEATPFRRESPAQPPHGGNSSPRRSDSAKKPSRRRRHTVTVHMPAVPRPFRAEEDEDDMISQEWSASMSSNSGEEHNNGAGRPHKNEREQTSSDSSLRERTVSRRPLRSEEVVSETSSPTTSHCSLREQCRPSDDDVRRFPPHQRRRKDGNPPPQDINLHEHELQSPSAGHQPPRTAIPLRRTSTSAGHQPSAGHQRPCYTSPATGLFFSGRRRRNQKPKSEEQYETIGLAARGGRKLSPSVERRERSEEGSAGVPRAQGRRQEGGRGGRWNVRTRGDRNASLKKQRSDAGRSNNRGEEKPNKHRANRSGREIFNERSPTNERRREENARREELSPKPQFRALFRRG